MSQCGQRSWCWWKYEMPQENKENKEIGVDNPKLRSWNKGQMSAHLVSDCYMPEVHSEVAAGETLQCLHRSLTLPCKQNVFIDDNDEMCNSLQIHGELVAPHFVLPYF